MVARLKILHKEFTQYCKHVEKFTPYCKHDRRIY